MTVSAVKRFFRDVCRVKLSKGFLIKLLNKVSGSLADPYEDLEERFFKYAESYFRFITEPDIAPTNNVAEQALRFIAVQRRITQGTRGLTGQLWCERIWTVIGTCDIQDRSVLEFLIAAVTAHFTQQPAPMLIVPVNNSE